MEPAFLPIAALVKAGLRILDWRVDVRGEGHLPDGPAVLASNHVSYLDPIMLGWVVERRDRVPRFLAKQELFDHRLLGPLMRTLRQVPVDRAGDPARSLAAGAARLRAGDHVVVFPEGTISTAFVPAEPRHGAARLALATGVPLVPAAVWGGQRILTKHRPRNIRRRVPLVVHLGQPVPYEATETTDVITARLWTAVRALVDEVQRTYPDRPAGPDDRWWLPRHLGGTSPSVEEAAARRRAETAARRRREGAATAR